MLGRVLVVDDESLQRKAIQGLVTFHLSFATVSAENGEQAVAMLEEDVNSEIMLVMMDFNMGDGMNGLETLKKIKQIKPEIPVVMITSEQNEALIEEAMEAGAIDYLDKPPPVPRLKATVENAIENYILKQELNQLKGG